MSGQPERPVDPAGAAEAEQGETRPDEENVQPAEAGGSDARLAEAEAKAAENWDRYLRAAAELENVRKRAARDVEHAHKYALENFGRELLQVKDSLELGIAAGESADAAALLEGSEATLKLLSATLERFDIVELDPVGEPFDPQLHEAMTMQPSAEAAPGSVLTVIQKGYELNGRLLRPARVIVAADMPQGDQAGTAKS